MNNIPDSDLSQEFVQAIIDATLSNVCVIDNEGKIITVNQSWRDFWDQNRPFSTERKTESESYSVGSNYLQICNESKGLFCEGARDVAEGIRKTLCGELALFSWEYTCDGAKQRRWFLLRATPFKDSSGFCVISHTDITQQKSTEISIARSTQALRALSACNLSLTTAESQEDFLKKACIDLVETGDYAMAWIGRHEKSHSDFRILEAARAGLNWTHQQSLSISSKNFESQNRLASEALLDSKTVVARKSCKTPENSVWPKFLQGLGYRSFAILPITDSTQRKWLLCIYSQYDESFADSEIELLEDMAQSITMGLDLFETKTQRKLLEHSLLESEDQFKILIEESPVGVHILVDGIIKYANPRMEHILGRSQDSLLGVNMESIVDPQDWSVYNKFMDSLSKYKNTGNFSVRAKMFGNKEIQLGLQYVIGRFAGEVALIGMCQDISERVESQAEIARYLNLLEQNTEDTLQAVAAMVEKRDPYTAGHERRVGILAGDIAAEMGLSEHTIKGLRMAGFVHDVGKIGIPAEILVKPSRLSEVEMMLIRTHAQAGFEVLENIKFPWPIAKVALQHHERINGSGYPQGLIGDQIILEARIATVADVVESMSSHRPYRPSLGIEVALNEIEKNRGILYDPSAVDACLRLFREKGYQLPDK